MKTLAKLFPYVSGLSFLCSCQEPTLQHTISAKTIEVLNKTYIGNSREYDFLDDWSTENTIVYHVIGEPNDMHPTNGNSGNRSFVNNYIHGFLLTADLVSLNGLQPSLVKRMPTISENQLDFTYELRDEPTWDDGSQLSVDDVVFTLKANRCPLTNNPHSKPFIENLQEIELNPDNPREFTLKMKKHYMHNTSMLMEFPMMQESFWDPNHILRSYTISEFDNSELDLDNPALNNWITEFNDYKYGTNPNLIVGLGAYQFSEWKTGQSFSLLRKTNHWTSTLTSPSVYETAYPERIIFKLNTDENSQILEFKTQVLDGSNALSSSAFTKLKESEAFIENYHAQATPTFNYTHLRFNLRPDGIKHKKFFEDVTVRRAIAHLVKYDEMNQVLYQGMRSRIPGPVSPLKTSFNKSLRLIDHDLEFARQLLAEAGWIDSDNDNIRDKLIDGQKVDFEFDLLYMSNSDSWKDMALMISESLYEAGIKCNPVQLEFTVLKDKSRNHDFDAALAAWGGSSFAEDFTQIWHTESWASKGLNYGGFGNSESDALIDSIKFAMTEDERFPLVQKLQKLIYDNQPYVFLFASNRTNVMHKRFGNADMYYEKPGIVLNNLQLLGIGVVPMAGD
ncbi:MAG: hypothetical protein K9J17_11425 [Flavobacteriales bacterium]|nr:hypothetical protein [Flavobacteriales bacterium]